MLTHQDGELGNQGLCYVGPPESHNAAIFIIAVLPVVFDTANLRLCDLLVGVVDSSPLFLHALGVGVGATGISSSSFSPSHKSQACELCMTREAVSCVPRWRKVLITNHQPRYKTRTYVTSNIEAT